MSDIRAYPAAAFIRFCENHGLLRILDRPLWRTVEGGARAYVTRLTAATPIAWREHKMHLWMLEMALQNQFSIGGVATFVRVPIIYSGPTCSQCGAHLDLSSIGASFHAGGGPGLNQILEVSAGAAVYRNFRRDSNGQQLPPTGGNIDPFFTFGYGFGYTFNPTMQVSVVQDYGLVLHERTGLANDQSNTLTQRSTRLNVRMGFGKRSTRR